MQKSGLDAGFYSNQTETKPQFIQATINIHIQVFRK